MKELKNGRSKLVKCDGQVLKTIILAKGFKPYELGVLMGYDRTYFNKCIRTNTIGVKAVEKLREYKIMPAMYDADINGLDPKSKEKFRKQEAKEIANAGGLEEAEKLITADTNEEEKSPVEKAMNEPGVVKIELTLDMVKLKAIIKQAVKEAYEEL